MGGNKNALYFLVRIKNYTFLETIGHCTNLSIDLCFIFKFWEVQDENTVKN